MEYKHKCNLTTHIGASHEDRLFTCDYCKKNLKSKQSIERHIQKMHLTVGEKVKVYKYGPRKPRSDKGTTKKSMVSTLLGLVFDSEREKALLRRHAALDHGIKV